MLYICTAKCSELDCDNSRHCIESANNENEKFELLNKECPCGNIPNWELLRSKNDKE
jgi:hypothetical protein